MLTYVDLPVPSSGGFESKGSLVTSIVGWMLMMVGLGRKRENSRPSNPLAYGEDRGAKKETTDLTGCSRSSIFS